MIRDDKNKKQKCDCNTSTGICGNITRGTGRLDFNGYWEFPCPHGNALEEYHDEDYKDTTEESQ
jgi:hypothetical protein